MFVRAAERAVQPNVSLVTREAPVDHSPLNRLGNALVSLFDRVKGEVSTDHFGRLIEQRSGRSRRTVASATVTASCDSRTDGTRTDSIGVGRRRSKQRIRPEVRRRGVGGRRGGGRVSIVMTLS
jgi:hypothetical protein